MKSQILWMGVTKDELELPLCVFDSARELADYFEVNLNTIYEAMSKAKANGRRCKYVKVEVVDEERQTKTDDAC